MGTGDVQLARVEALINILLVDIHLCCCCACHLFWWSVVVAVGVKVASVNEERFIFMGYLDALLDAVGAHKQV